MVRSIPALIALILASACSYYSLSRGAGCFAAGTLVKTPEGWIAIEDLAPDDEVISFDEETGAFTVGIVETVTEQPAKAILHISLGSEEIQVTGDHPVLTAERTWVPIGELSEGTALTTLGADYKVETKGIETVRSTKYDAMVYNVKVRRYENAVVEGLVARFY